MKSETVVAMKKGKGWWGDSKRHSKAVRKGHALHGTAKKTRGGGQIDRELVYRLESLLLALEFEYPDIYKKLPAAQAAKKSLTKNKGVPQ